MHALILALLLIASPVHATWIDDQFTAIAAINESAATSCPASCAVASDLYAETTNSTNWPLDTCNADTVSGYVAAQQFVIASTKCIGQYRINFRGEGSPDATLNFQVYSDSSGPNNPVAGTATTKAASTVTVGSWSEYVLALPASVELPAGTYYLVAWVSDVTTYGATDYVRFGYNNVSGSGAWRQTTPATCPPDNTGWADRSGSNEGYFLEVEGCDQS